MVATYKLKTEMLKVVLNLTITGFIPQSKKNWYIEER